MFFSCPASLRVRVHPTSAFVNHSRHAHTFPQGTCFHNAYKNIRNAHTYRHVHSSLFQLGSREAAAAADFGSCSVKLTASKSRNTKRKKKHTHTKTKPNQHSNSNPTKFTERGEGEKLSLLNLRTIPVRFPLVKLQASGCNAGKEPRAHRERFGDFERLPHPVGHPTWTKRRVTDSRGEFTATETTVDERRQHKKTIQPNNTATPRWGKGPEKEGVVPNERTRITKSWEDTGRECANDSGRKQKKWPDRGGGELCLPIMEPASSARRRGSGNLIQRRLMTNFPLKKHG